MPGDLAIKSLRDHLLDSENQSPTPGARAAAVLVPFMKLDDDWVLVFTRRAEDLSTHQGEISFPGGRVDEGESSLSAALREAHEELGIVPEHVEVLGRLQAVFTVVSNFEIQPWVGIIPKAEFKPNPHEISEVLEVPIDLLLTGDARRIQKFIGGGLLYRNPAFDFEAHTIWGATARILDGVLDLLR